MEWWATGESNPDQPIMSQRLLTNELVAPDFSLDVQARQQIGTETIQRPNSIDDIKDLLRVMIRRDVTLGLLPIATYFLNAIQERVQLRLEGVERAFEARHCTFKIINCGGKGALLYFSFANVSARHEGDSPERKGRNQNNTIPSFSVQYLIAVPTQIHAKEPNWHAQKQIEPPGSGPCEEDHRSERHHFGVFH